jgi:MFS family permease
MTNKMVEGGRGDNNSSGVNRKDSSNFAAAASLVIARTFYGVNWFNIAAVFPLIALEFGRDLSLLASISSAFLVGVGAFQIPSGLFAARYSPRTSALVGIAVSSSAALASGLISDASQLIWLRFVVGLGMAFFFSSGVVLIAGYAGRRSPGLSIGVMNAAHSMGGIIGMFGWIIIAVAIGWRQSLILGGAIGLATALLMALALPKKKEEESAIEQGSKSAGLAAGSDSVSSSSGRSSRQLGASEIIKILANRPTVALGLVLTGIQAAWAITLTFIVVYLQGLGASFEMTGMVASAALVSAIVSAPLMGRVYDRVVRDARKVLALCGAAIGIGMASISTAAFPVIIAAVVVIGFFAGGAFTVAYAKARKTPVRGLLLRPAGAKGTGLDYGALNVAWVNGMSLLGVLWMPLVFSFAVKYGGGGGNGGGYPAAWILSGIMAALFALAPIFKVDK